MITGQKGITAGQLLVPETLIVDPDRLQRLLILHPAWVRVPLRVGTRSTGWDADLLKATAQLGGILRDHGIKIIAMVNDETLLGSTQAVWDNPDPVQHAKWVGTFTKQLVPILQAWYWVTEWEIWNEPNNGQNYPKGGPVTGGTYIRPTNFLRLIKAASATLKARNSAIQVISGGVVSHNIHGTLSTANAGVDYLGEVYAANGKKAFADGLGVHLYIDQAGRLAPEHMQLYLLHYAGLSWRNEGFGVLRDLYVTEMGWETTGGLTDQIQGDDMRGAYGVLSNNLPVKAACWYSLEDGNGKWGMYNPGGSPKYSAAVYSSIQ